MKHLCRFDLNAACALTDEELEKVGEAILDLHKEAKKEFNKNFYFCVDYISGKLINRNMANFIYKLSQKGCLNHDLVAKKFIEKYGNRKKLIFLMSAISKVSDQNQLLGWALCVSASRFLKRKQDWVFEPNS